MIRFIDLTNQITDDQPAFAWFNAVTNSFLCSNGKRIWKTWNEFQWDYAAGGWPGPSLERLSALFPKAYMGEVSDLTETPEQNQASSRVQQMMTDLIYIRRSGGLAPETAIEILKLHWAPLV